MKIDASTRIIENLASKSPPVAMREIYECFATRDRTFLIDNRENNRTDPPTLWFISDTFMGRFLKIVFIKTADKIVIKTAYDPNPVEIAIYQNKSSEET